MGRSRSRHAVAVAALAPRLERMLRLHSFLLSAHVNVVRVSGMAETRAEGGPSAFARNEHAWTINAMRSLRTTSTGHP